MTVTVSIDHDLYHRESLEETRDRYARYCSVKSIKSTKRSTVIAISVQNEFQARQENIVREFLNHMLDLAAQHWISADSVSENTK